MGRLLGFSVFEHGEVVTLEAVNWLSGFVGDDNIEEYDVGGRFEGGRGVAGNGRLAKAVPARTRPAKSMSDTMTMESHAPGIALVRL